MQRNVLGGLRLNRFVEYVWKARKLPCKSGTNCRRADLKYSISRCNRRLLSVRSKYAKNIWLHYLLIHETHPTGSKFLFRFAKTRFTARRDVLKIAIKTRVFRVPRAPVGDLIDLENERSPLVGGAGGRGRKKAGGGKRSGWKVNRRAGGPRFRSCRSCSSLERKSKMVIKIRSRGEARRETVPRRRSAPAPPSRRAGRREKIERTATSEQERARSSESNAPLAGRPRVLPAHKTHMHVHARRAAPRWT